MQDYSTLRIYSHIFLDFCLHSGKTVQFSDKSLRLVGQVVRKTPEEGAEVGRSLWVGPERPLPLAQQLPRSLAQLIRTTFRFPVLSSQYPHPLLCSSWGLDSLPKYWSTAAGEDPCEALRRSKMGPVTFSPRVLSTGLRRYSSLATTRKR